MSVDVIDIAPPQFVSLKSLLSSEDNRHFRFFPRRPTLVASDASLPLHVQVPAVHHLSWDTADNVIGLAASDGEVAMWRRLTAPYRDAAATAALWDTRDRRGDVSRGSAAARLFDDDIDKMLASGFAAALAPHEEPRGFLRLYSVLEEHKSRRRLIAWPRAYNEAERLVARQLRAVHGEIPFADVAEVRAGVQRRFAAQLDWKKYFQQFRLDETAALYFVFQYHDVCYRLATVPTGAVAPPLFGQLLTRACCALALRRADAAAAVSFDAMIDNVRLVSDDYMSLCRAWESLLTILRDVGITIGDMQPPCATMQTYVFLGLLFDHGLFRVTAADKTRRKLREALCFLDNLTEACCASDLAAIFGVCVFASRVVDFALHQVYHILKFVRRTCAKIAGDYTIDVLVWPSILPLWKEWISFLLLDTTAYFHRAPSTQPPTVVYTDASLKGWGAYICHPSGWITMLGGAWSTAEATLDINHLETLAVKRAVLSGVIDGTSVELLIDNTTALSWVRKRHARPYLANAVIGDIDTECTARGVHVASAAYVPSAKNFADALSRLGRSVSLTTDARLRPQDNLRSEPLGVGVPELQLSRCARQFRH